MDLAWFDLTPNRFISSGKGAELKNKDKKGESS